jgi:uncharacterized protein (TIGR03382 family)
MIQAWGENDMKKRVKSNITRRRGAASAKSDAPRNTPILGFFVLLLFVVLGGLGCWYSARPLYFGFASKSWPTVQGRVVQSLDGEWKRSQNGGPGYRSSKPTVTYEYEVEGRTFTGSCISFSSDAVPTHVTGRYPDGGGATVHYDADAPERSVLMPGFHEAFDLWLYFWVSLFTALLTLDRSIQFARRLHMEMSTSSREVSIKEPRGLIVREDMCYADGTSLRLDFPKTRPSYDLYTRIFVMTMLLLFPAWFCSDGRISFLSIVIASGAVWVVFVFMYVKAAPRMVVLIERKEVTLSEMVGSETANWSCWSWDDACMPIRKIENILSNESNLSMKYFDRSKKRMVTYARTSDGLPPGTLPWLAALLVLLQTRRRVTTSSKRELPVWKLYGFPKLSDFLAAVKG